jgi:hypothetical protein
MPSLWIAWNVFCCADCSSFMVLKHSKEKVGSLAFNIYLGVWNYFILLLTQNFKAEVTAHLNELSTFQRPSTQYSIQAQLRAAMEDFQGALQFMFNIIHLLLVQFHYRINHFQCPFTVDLRDLDSSMHHIVIFPQLEPLVLLLIKFRGFWKSSKWRGFASCLNSCFRDGPTNVVYSFQILPPVAWNVHTELNPSYILLK